MADRLRVVLANDAIVAADKPAGVLTVPGRFADDPRPVLGRELEAALACRLYPVHRLDADVSGLVVFAKTSDAQRVASKAFEGRRVRKTYEALTTGDANAARARPEHRWESRLVRGKKRAFAAPHGDLAITRALLLDVVPARPWTNANGGELLRWRVEPLTGRPHQIRVHLTAAGFPIVGDELYGSKVPFAQPGIALRAVRLELLDDADARALGLAGPIDVGPWDEKARAAVEIGSPRPTSG